MPLMRKLILLVILLSIPGLAFCDDRKKKPKPMPVSRWREIKRMSPDSAVVAFTDTVFIEFMKKDSFSFRHKDGFVYLGLYAINEDSVIDFGYFKYNMPVRNAKGFTLTDTKGIYTFVTDWSDTAKVIILDKEEKILPVTSIDQMIGHWQVYKRTSDEPLTTLDNENQVRSMYITGPSTDGKLGFIYSSKDLQEQPSWHIKAYTSDQSLLGDGKSPRTFKVIKCQKGEMILQEGVIKYYFKQFK
jgi:hypothetical protein